MTAVTFRRLESLGRLGNQCWEIASTLGIAEKMGLPAVFRRWSFAPYFSVPDTLWVDTLPGYAIDAETTSYVQHIAERHRPYMQDRNLWAHIEDRIVAYFQRSALAEQIMRIKNPAFFDIPPEERIGVHIRRGDAVAVPLLFPVQSTRYVTGALEQLGDDGTIYVFTDDPGWAYDHLGGLGAHVVVGNADWEDMLLMSQCGRLAIANSSFSYWAATIGQSPHVCYPLRWYGRKFHDVDYKLMIPPGWVGIDDPEAGKP